MSLNLYANLGTTYSGIVTGAELERVSQEIFGGAQVKSGEQIGKVSEQTQQQQTLQSTQAEVDLYNRNTDLALTQQVSKINVDYNVQLSQQTLQNIEALKTLAATQQTNVHKLNEGKIYIPVDNSQPTDVANIFALKQPTSIIKPFSMEKDRKGSSPFAYTQQNTKKSNTENSDSINIIM